MTPADNLDRMSAAPWASIRDFRVFCVGNGGLICRNGRLWTHRFLCDFLVEMGTMVREVRMCGWLEPGDDPLSQTALEHLPRVRGIGLPPFHGSVPRKLANGIHSFAILLREVCLADFVYLYWPGRLSSLTARLCRAIGKPYGIYFRGTQTPSDPTFAAAFSNASFALTAGLTLRAAAQAHCQDVETVTPMNYVRSEHVRPPQVARALGPCRILYVGRLEESKGVQDLLAALSYLDQWGVPFHLTMVGHCADPDRLLRELPPRVAARLRMVGVVSEFEKLIPFYCAADLFVFPSHEEGFPRVLYEAMAFGVPILTTFVGGIPAIMKDGENCLRIEAKNPRAIAETIRQAIASPQLRGRIAWTGHECIRHLMKTWQRSHSVQIAERLREFVVRGSERAHGPRRLPDAETFHAE